MSLIPLSHRSKPDRQVRPKRGSITEMRCETLYPWAAYALMSVSASQIEFRTLERALPYSPKGAFSE
jgi:hypothetical protein